MRTPESIRKHWDGIAGKLLTGRKITSVRYMGDDEAERQMGWDRCGLVIELDNGLQLILSQDDEGNGPGALFTSIKDHDTLPVL